jgi:uncharacterized protein
MITRRKFLYLTSATAIGVGLYGWTIEPHWLEIVRWPMPIQHLPPNWAGKTLVQLSDIHAGPRVDSSYIRETFRRVQELNPDIVVFTGDFIDYNRDIFKQISAIYRSCPKGRLATLGVLGNHDYGPSWSHPEIAEELVEILQANGITILRNQIKDLDGFQIIGLDDFWADQFDLETALANLDVSRPSLALSHNPDTVDLSGWEKYNGWILSGHTHGGQCRPPFLPPPILPVRNKRYTAGELELSGNRKLYISRGVGHLLKVRFNVRPEVTVFQLKRA